MTTSPSLTRRSATPITGSTWPAASPPCSPALDAKPAATPGAVLTLTGSTLISKVGGASGPLYGTAFRRAGQALGAADEVDLAALGQALEAALAGVQQLGAAREGDKTMVDALAPATRALAKAVAEGAAQADALAAAAAAAAEGAAATVSMQARKGRASYLGPRSVGHEDPGAASTVLILTALRDAAARDADPARHDHVPGNAGLRGSGGRRALPAGRACREGNRSADAGRDRGRRRASPPPRTVTVTADDVRAAFAAVAADRRALAGRLRAAGRGDEADIVTIGALMAADPALSGPAIDALASPAAGPGGSGAGGGRRGARTRSG